MAKVSGPRQNFIMNFARYRYREIQSLLVIGVFFVDLCKMYPNYYYQGAVFYQNISCSCPPSNMKKIKCMVCS